jgi:hypothetical protein
VSIPPPGEPRHGVMRDYEEIQRAHDILKALVCGEIQGVAVEGDAIHAALDVLCWALGHDHNPSFATNLARLEQQIAEHGYVLNRVN